MRNEELSIAYEVLARAELGIKESMARSYEKVRWPFDFGVFQKEIWCHVLEFSLQGPYRGYFMSRHIDAALKLPGDFVEFGCFRGGTSYMMGLMIKRAKTIQRVYMCDNWDNGLPKPDRAFDKAYVEGSMVYPVQKVRENITRLGLDSQCIPMHGLFTDTISNFPDNQRFSMVHIDCDLYHGVNECLEYIYPRLADTAPVFMDDYYDESHGVMRAMNEFAVRHNIVIHLSIEGQAYWINGERPEDTDASQVDIEGNTVWMTTDAVRESPGFLDGLQYLVEDRQKRVDRLQDFINFCRKK
jgi:hypothetical protein